jgi:two-component system nitrate/nitrite response regulator NarL
MAPERVRVVLADDHELFRNGVARALGASPLVELVAEAGDGCQALEQAAVHRPDVAVLDYRLPGLDGIAVISAMARERLPTRTLLLSAYDESAIVCEALRAGAWGYLSKEVSRGEIVAGVVAVARGEFVLAPEVADRLVAEIAGGERIATFIGKRSE